MQEGLKISKSILDTSEEVVCPNPDCNSKLFFPTISVRKVSALMTGTGKPGAITQSGPLLCVKCHRELVDADFGYKNQEDKEIPDLIPHREDGNDESTG